MMDLNILMMYGAMTLFAAFIPVLAGLSVYLRHHRANTRLDAAVTLYGLNDDRYYKIYVENKLPDLWKQTWFPILVMFLISLYFSFILIRSSDVLVNDTSNLLVLGPMWKPGQLSDDMKSYRISAFVTISFAYLGWYVWSIATIFSRLSTLELVAATYTNMLIRLVMGVIIAIVFLHLSSSLFDSTVSTVAIGFGVGIFPDTALVWLSRQLRRRLLGETDTDKELPLDLIQGISPYRKIRLYEMGLDNCQNLAESNPILLFITSNLSLLEILDWISQAQLAVVVGADRFGKLQANGWRQARDFARACGSTAKPVVSALIGYDERQLDDLQDGLLNDPTFRRVEALQRRISAADDEANASAAAGPASVTKIVPSLVKPAGG
jgi:hypothetical protein